MTQTRTQLRKVDNGLSASKQGRRANAVGANIAQYGYKVPVVHSMRTFGSMCDLPQNEYRGVAQLVARLLWEQDAGSSSLPTTTKNRLFSRFFLCFR